MIRFAGAFITVVTCTVFGSAYALLFIDEMDPKNPANIGAGIFAPMYRHWVEYPLVIWMTFLIVVVAYYWLLGDKRIVVNWSVASQWWFRLHVASAAVILFGLVAALAVGQRLHVRDAVTALVGLAFLAIGVWERLTTRPQGVDSPDGAIVRVRR